MIPSGPDAQPDYRSPRKATSSSKVLPSPELPGLGLSTGPCRTCRDSGTVYAWWLIEGSWQQAIGPCECVCVGDGDYV